MRNRISVMHGVNLDALGRRPAEHYGDLTLSQLEREVGGFAHELGLEVRFFQTNFEGEYVEEIHRAPDYADALLLNPGAELPITDELRSVRMEMQTWLQANCNKGGKVSPLPLIRTHTC